MSSKKQKATLPPLPPAARFLWAGYGSLWGFVAGALAAAWAGKLLGLWPPSRAGLRRRAK